jgi:predicted unusual protein kinase regulating ubiquinone biosynthesis (AarF/ABC1/UbiB family)
LTRKPERSSRVPTRRLERLARIGWMSGEFALGGVAEGVKRLIGSGASDASIFLSGASAERLARRLSRMRGAAMKIGQMLSLADEDLLPAEFAEALAVLRASADMMPTSQVRRTLLKEYGKEWKQRFRSFDFDPIAAASIGQVHTAVAANGRELALKIQYPGVAESIESDVDNLATALKGARILPLDLDLDGIIAETKHQLRQEADYHAEADFLRRYRALISDCGAFVVPEVHDDLTTTHILAMDRILGLPLEDLTGPEHPQELRDQVAASLLELVFRELFEFGLVQTDPNFSNYFLLPDGRTLGLLDFGATREIPPELSRQYKGLLRAVLDQDRAALRQASAEIGFLREDDSGPGTERFLDLVELVFEPLSFRGIYDFGASNLTIRARDAGLELALRHGFIRIPPPQTMFLNRKLDGTLMLCTRLRARVNARSLVEPFVGEG